MSENMFSGDTVSSNRILYTPTDFARLSLCHLQEIGSLTAQKPHTSRREHLDSYLFFMVTSGSGVLWYENQLHELSSGDFVFIDCRKAYYHQTGADLWSLKWVHFNGPTMPGIYAKYKERGGQPVIHGQDFRQLSDLWSSLFATASGDDHIRDMRINEALCSLLTCIMACSWSKGVSTPTGKRSELLDVRKYLDEHFADKITLDELSEIFYINKFYLTRVFREQFGVSIGAYLTHVRITHAKRLLRFSDSSTEEIGSLVGLSPGYYFSRTFKKIEGVSPSEYRKAWVK